MIEYFNEDCMTGMARYPDKHFDLAIVDPPYGININQMNMGGRDTIKPTDKNWDNEIPSQQYFNELMRVSKEQIIWGGELLSVKTIEVFHNMGQRRNDVWKKFRGM